MASVAPPRAKARRGESNVSIYGDAPVYQVKRKRKAAEISIFDHGVRLRPAERIAGNGGMADGQGPSRPAMAAPAPAPAPAFTRNLPPVPFRPTVSGLMEALDAEIEEPLQAMPMTRSRSASLLSLPGVPMQPTLSGIFGPGVYMQPSLSGILDALDGEDAAQGKRPVARGAPIEPGLPMQATLSGIVAALDGDVAPQQAKRREEPPPPLPFRPTVSGLMQALDGEPSAALAPPPRGMPMTRTRSGKIPVVQETPPTALPMQSTVSNLMMELLE